MGEGFYGSVRSSLHNLQILTKQVNTLMVTTVDKHMGAEQGMEKIALQIIGGVEYIFFRMPVEFRVRDFFDRAAEIEVDQLHAFTNAKDGLVLLIE